MTERPWRRAIPAEHEIAPRIPFKTKEDQYNAVKMVIDELNLENLRKGHQVDSSIDLKMYGHLPEKILQKLQFIADLSAQFLARPADKDPFPNHELRTNFKKKHKVDLGSEFRNRFENNRFRLSLTTTLVSQLKQLREIISPNKIITFGRRAEFVDVPQSAELLDVIESLDAFLGDARTLNERYEIMPLISQKEGEIGKLDVVDATAAAAIMYLELVTNRPIADELDNLDFKVKITQQ